MPLVWFCCAFLLGIVIGDWLQLPVLPVSLTAAWLVAVSGLWWRWRDLRLPLLLAACVLFGVARIALARPITTEQRVWGYAGHKVTITGVVTQQPDRREDKQTAVIEAQQVATNGVVRAIDGHVLLKLPSTPELRYGQRVMVEGLMDRPKQGDDFDYRAYLARHGIHVLMIKPKLTLLPGTGGTWWQRTMLILNDQARRPALHLIAEPHASLLVGILLNVRS